MRRYLGGTPDQVPARYAAVDMRRLIAPDNPPTLILAGARTRLVLFPYSGHRFNTTFDSVTNQTVIQVIAQFLADQGLAP